MDVLKVKIRQDLFDQQITIAMSMSKGNKTKAAKLLGISERQLYREIDRRLQQE